MIRRAGSIMQVIGGGKAGLEIWSLMGEGELRGGS